MNPDRSTQINEWMDARPVIRHYVNGEVIEITGEDRRAIFEQAYDENFEEESRVQAQKLRAASRVALRAAWDALPAFIRGPYRPEFEAANRLLDEGDDAGAIALIEYAPAKPDFTIEQVATFAAVKAQMKAGIEALPGA